MSSPRFPYLLWDAIPALTLTILAAFALTTATPFGLRACHGSQLPQEKSQDSEYVDRGTIRYPLKGHIALTNVGKPVSGMQVECYVNGWKKRIAVTKTNSTGGFSFPDLPEGKYYLKASGLHVFTVRTIVTTTKKSTNVLSLITEGCDQNCESDPVLE
jgi:hypothetical protein